MVVLSEKAKGKQRAIDPPVDSNTEASSSLAVGRDIVVRFTEGYEDHTLRLLPEHTVRGVKKLVQLAPIIAQLNNS
jgi:hypothetical protein